MGLIIMRVIYGTNSWEQGENHDQMPQPNKCKINTMRCMINTSAAIRRPDNSKRQEVDYKRSEDMQSNLIFALSHIFAITLI